MKILTAIFCLTIVLLIGLTGIGEAKNHAVPCALSVNTQHSPGEGHFQFRVHFTLENTTDKPIFSAIIKVVKKDGTQITA